MPISVAKQAAWANQSSKVDKLILGSLTGVPIFLMTMYLLFLVSINFGGALIDFQPNRFMTKYSQKKPTVIGFCLQF